MPLNGTARTAISCSSRGSEAEEHRTRTCRRYSNSSIGTKTNANASTAARYIPANRICQSSTSIIIFSPNHGLIWLRATALRTGHGSSTPSRGKPKSWWEIDSSGIFIRRAGIRKCDCKRWIVTALICRSFRPLRCCSRMTARWNMRWIVRDCSMMRRLSFAAAAKAG